MRPLFYKSALVSLPLMSSTLRCLSQAFPKVSAGPSVRHNQLLSHSNMEGGSLEQVKYDGELKESAQCKDEELSRVDATAVERRWDAENGIWIGPQDLLDVPSPLWIFGYGSLCWRPEEAWAKFETKHGVVRGYQRRFFQRSMDHRGTPAFPGLVVTIIKDSDLEELKAREPGSQPSETYGVTYRVPDEVKDSVLYDLDYREKGGYTRAIVDVHCTDEYGGGTLKALLYTGTTDNPNFHIVSDEEAAIVIANAHGPSGPNTEYLFNLAEFLSTHGVVDDHVETLAARVKQLKNANKPEQLSLT